MSMYLLPKTLVADLDKQRRSFFWQGGVQKRKYHPVKWELICKSKSKGGLGIKDMRKMNICLLSKWWWHLENEKGIWQDIVKAKYLIKSEVGNVSHKIDDSPVWSDLLKVKKLLPPFSIRCIRVFGFYQQNRAHHLGTCHSRYPSN